MTETTQIPWACIPQYEHSNGLARYNAVSETRMARAGRNRNMRMVQARTDMNLPLSKVPDIIKMLRDDEDVSTVGSFPRLSEWECKRYPLSNWASAGYPLRVTPRSGYKNNKDWCGTAKSLASFYGYSPEWLWPEFSSVCVKPLDGHIIPDPTQGLEQRVEDYDFQCKLTNILFDHFGCRNTYFICARIGICGFDLSTLEELGQQFGLSRERVRQIEEKGLEYLRRPWVLQQLDIG